MIFSKKDFFSLFGLERRFQISLEHLEEAYYLLQSKVHPDRFSRASEVEKSIACEFSADINFGYGVLKSPIHRAGHILCLNGILVDENRLPSSFLSQQIKWYEMLDDALGKGKKVFLQRFVSLITLEKEKKLLELSKLIDVEADYFKACEALQQLVFIDRLYQKSLGLSLA